MTELLKKAFERVSKELPDYEQDAIGKWLINLIDSDEREWGLKFAASPDKLAKLADRALAEYSEGRTELLDPEKL